MAEGPDGKGLIIITRGATRPAIVWIATIYKIFSGKSIYGRAEVQKQKKAAISDPYQLDGYRKGSFRQNLTDSIKPP